MTTPTKPTINQILINCHVWYECPCRDCEKSLKEAKSQLLQLVLDDVIGKDDRDLAGIDPYYGVSEFEALEIKFEKIIKDVIRQRAREILT